MRRKNSKVAIISPKGINTSTPDNTVEDGACEVLQNMRIKDGAWRNMGALGGGVDFGNFSFVDGDETRVVSDILYRHPAAPKDHYVVVLDVVVSAQTTSREIVSISVGMEARIEQTFHSGSFDQVRVMHLGRLLILNIDGVMSYWRATEGAYAEVSLPAPITVSIPKKVMRSEPFDFIHTKNARKVYTTELSTELTSYLAPCPIYAYNDGDGSDSAEVLVYHPIYNGDNGAFIQPTTLNDWWQGEMCFFAVYKTTDGHFIRPSALNIIASEVDNAGILEDRIIPRAVEDSFSYGIMPSECAEQGLSGENITIDTGGKVTGQGALPTGAWSWMTTRIGVSEGAALGKSLGIFSRHDGDSSVAKRVMSNALMIAPRCRISFVNSDSALIDSIVIFATRIHSRWDSSKLQSAWDANTDATYMNIEPLSFSQAFADNKLPEQPFYKVLEIPRSEWGEEGLGSYTLDVALTGTLLENAEQKDVWEPINPHEVVYEYGKEINSMMHVYGATRQKLFEGFGSNGFMQENAFCSPLWPVATSLKIDDTYYSVSNICGFDLLDASLRKNIISYPDARAKQIYNGTAIAMQNAYDLTPAPANNYAYYLADIFESLSNSQALQYYETIAEQDIYYCKFPRRWKDTNTYIDGERVPVGVAFTDGSQYSGDSVDALSELRVSALSNPFIFPLARTYQIGSSNNKIIAVNSAAIELSDDKIGEYPTWVFTTEGVFVGYWGSDDVIYQSFLPRTYDKAINPITLTVNGSILYVTKQGLMAINDRGSSLLSSPLNDSLGQVPYWLAKTTVIGWQYDTNEVFVADDDGDLYVYNLGAGVWSTRRLAIPDYAIESIKLLSNETLICNDLICFNAQEENFFVCPAYHNTPRRIITRPIKLGSYEMKRIETLVARSTGLFDTPCTLSVLGSIDGVNYGVLRTVTVEARGPIRLARFPMSVRYIKISIEFDPCTNIEFTSFDIEYFNRFINRLR